MQRIRRLYTLRSYNGRDISSSQMSPKPPRAFLVKVAEDIEEDISELFA